MTKGEKAALLIGGAALILFAWPKGKVAGGVATLRAVGPPPLAYTPGTPENARLTAAQDAWYAQHPDEPFTNDDGTVNLLPGYDL